MTIKFGTAGIPASTQHSSTTAGIKRLKELNLSAMELAFVRGVYIHNDSALIVKKCAEENNITLTAHAPYFINLNAKEAYKIESSIKRIIEAAKIASLCGCKSLILHAGFYMKDSKEDTYEKIKEKMKLISNELKENNVDIILRPETMGKESQFGSLQELIKLSKEIDNVLPCIDISHLFARSLGKNNSLEYFRNLLQEVKDNLGDRAIKNMHFHCSGIEYTGKGERKHLPLEESEFNYKDFLKAVKEFNVEGIIICESPLQELDALLLEKEFNSLY